MLDFKEKLFKGITYTASLFTIIALFGIIFSLFTEGIPILNIVKLKDFIGNTKWHPTMYPPDFGILFNKEDKHLIIDRRGIVKRLASLFTIRVRISAEILVLLGGVKPSFPR